MQWPIVLKRTQCLYIITLLIISMLIITPYTSNVIAGSGDFIGKIDINKIDTDGDLNSMLRINDTEFLLHCYMDTSVDGWVETRQCNSTGATQGYFTGVQIDEWEYGPSNGIGAGMAHVIGTDYYIIGYSVGSGSNSKYSTVKVTEDGSIDHWLYGNATSNRSELYFNITHLTGNYYVSVAQDYGADPDPLYLETLYVNSSNGTLWIVDSKQIMTDGRYPKVSRVTNNVVAVCCSGSGSYLNVTTWHINDTGDIGRLPIDTQTHNGIGASGKVGLLRVEDSNYYLATYTFLTGGAYYSGMGSVTIIPDGNITTDGSYGSNYEWTAGSGGTGYYPSPVTIQPNNIYGVCDGGRIYICNVSAGAITLHGNSNGYEVYTDGTRSSYYTDVIHFSENVFVGCFTTSGAVYEISFQIENNFAAPELTPSPPNGSTVSASPGHLSVYVADDNGDQMNIKWYSNMSGAWKYYGANNSVSNGTYTMYSSDFSSLAYNKTYHWRVDVTDYQTVHNTSELFNFELRYFGGGGSPSGTNQSDYVDLMPELSHNVSNAADNITWYWWNDTHWEWFANNETNFVPANYTQNFSNATECCRVYQWATLIENSVDGTSAWNDYWFISMCPSPPSNFAATRYNGTVINLTWTKWSNTNATGTVHTVIRYSNTSFPTSITDGILLTNTTNNYYNHTGITEGQTKYYSAFTVYQKGDAWCNSPTYTTKAQTATGGNYNITIRWENDNNIISHDTAFFDKINITFRYQNGSVIKNESLVNYGSNPFTITVDGTPDVIHITYGSHGILRSLTPNATERSQTFWFNNRSFWNGSDVDDLTDSQLYYKFSFQDLTPNSIFVSSPETKLYAYRDWNDSLTQEIHQMFLDAERNAWAFLEYGREYYFGIECDEEYRSYIGNFFAGQDQTYTFVLYPENDIDYFIDEYVNYSGNQTKTELWINYTDSSFKTNKVTVKIYLWHSNNGTIFLCKNYTFDNTSSFNQKWTTVEGYLSNETYLIEINITHDYFDDIINIKYYSKFYIKGRYDPGWFNSICEDIFGESPLSPVSYAGIVSFIMGFIFLVSFGQYNGEMGLFTCGFAVFFMEVVLWDASSFAWIAGPVSVLMIVLAIIFYAGKGGGRR